MKRPGQIVLFRFPQADLVEGKLRPALLLGQMPGPYDDWLICMISSQTHQHIVGFDELVEEGDVDYAVSGLKRTRLIRVGRLPVVAGDALLGAIGEISPGRLERIKKRLADWLVQH